MEPDTTTPNGTAESSRRRSGRVVRKPDIFSEVDHAGSILSNGSAKRKRADDGQGTEPDGDQQEWEEQSAEESDGEPDEEEVREKRRAQRRKAPAAKPATKRARTADGASTTLAIRSANIPGKPASKAAKTQRARARPSQLNKEGLFAEVFGRGQSAEDAANYWMSFVRKDVVAAIRDLINFVFECVGCQLKITSPDVEDIDNVPNKLGDILEEYAQDKSPEYPLISKSRQYADFRTVLVDFFSAIIKMLHNNGEIYDQPEIYENIHVWIATMSGAQYRPFRHTATVISLSMATALCEIAGEIQQSMATTKTQLDAEKKKKTSNKRRVSSIQDSMKADEKKLEAVDAHLRDAFDTVYVHRYRDVDEKIRVECVAALGHWIVTYRKMFLEGQYLRYLGWVMSDPNSPTRHEVIKQLKNLFKNQRNVAALRAFTDRFRPRMVEMGSRDADVGVRCETIELLDRLRNAELLEPPDIETIGRLIFDSELRVRKAVAKFFVANLEDLYNLTIEGYEEDQYNEALPPESEDFMSPNQEWIKFKCLASALAELDKDSASVDGDTDYHGMLRPENSDSRYMLATQAIFPHMKELSEWEALAGHLLHDHSSITAEPNDPNISLAVQGAYKLAAGEETVLLDVLYFSARMYLQSVLDVSKEKKGRANAMKVEVRKKQETFAQNLSSIIPQLLSRYGSTPQAATAILRLEQLLDADLINDLQGEGAYTALLDDINKQFATHSDRKVLAEASRALRTARNYEQSKEAADAKVLEIWEDASTTLQTLLKSKNVETRGTIERGLLSELLNTCVRLSNLASVSDCTEVLEGKIGGKKGKGKAQHDTLLALLVDLVKRGIPDEDTVGDVAESEDQICVAAITVISFYFRWKVVGLRTAIEKNDTRGLSTDVLVHLAMQRTNFVEALLPVISARLPLDTVRVTAILNALDLFTLFATMKHMRPAKGELDEDVATNIGSLLVPIPDDLLKEVMETHEKMEKSLARKMNRKITLPSEERRAKKQQMAEETQEEIERLPEDSDDELSDVEESDDGDEEVGSGKEKKREAALLTEQGLCELTSKLVLACFGGVVKGREEVKERLRVNRGKLGKSYGQVVAYLDERKEKGKAKGKGKGKGPRTPEKKKAQVEPMEVEGDEIEDDEMEIREDEEEVLREKGLDDDIDEGDDGLGEQSEVNGEAEDEIMGD